MSRALRQAFVLFLTAVIVWGGDAQACEPCAIFKTTRLREGEEGKWSLSFLEQYTSYQAASTGPSPNSLRDGEILKSYSVTQFDLGYDFNHWLSLGLSLPIIAREFDEVKNFRRRTDDESGIGDMAVYLSAAPYTERTVSHAIHTTVYAGIKMPTGDTGSLGDQVEFEEEEHADAKRLGFKHHQSGGIPGAGRILSLGTGSWDNFFGVGALTRSGRYVLYGTGEYSVRTEGDFDYRFANDVVWRTGPAAFLVLTDDFTLAIKAELSGEQKPKDVLAGNSVKGTALSHVYAGPGIFLTIDDRLAADFSLQLPVYTDDPDSIVLPEYRLNATVDWRF